MSEDKILLNNYNSKELDTMIKIKEEIIDKYDEFDLYSEINIKNEITIEEFDFSEAIKHHEANLQNLQLFSPNNTQMANDESNLFTEFDEAAKITVKKSNIISKNSNDNNSSTIKITNQSSLKKEFTPQDQEKKRFACFKCNSTFANEFYFNKHMEIHKMEKKLTCNYCYQVFQQKYTFDMHLRTHTGEQPHECSYCQKRFSIKSNLYRHERTHTGDKKFKCPNCNWKFIQASDLNKHLKTHENRQQIIDLAKETFECSYCNKLFLQKNTLFAHIQSHLKSKQFLNSQNLEKLDKAITAIKEHIHNKIDLNSEIYIKNEKTIEEYSFPKEVIKKHEAKVILLKNIQKDNDKSINVLTEIDDTEKDIESLNINEPSSLKISTDNNLLADMFNLSTKTNNIDRQAYEKSSSSETQLNEKPFKCYYCERTFAATSNLYRHLKLHANEKPFECSTCKIRFSYMSEFKEHNVKIHANDKVKVFKNPAAFGGSEKNSIFVCDHCKHCKRSFSNRSYLTKHMRIHTNEKPFKCKHCDRKFAIASNLYRHLKLHANEKPFECLTCKMKFSYMSEFKEHNVIIHSSNNTKIFKNLAALFCDKNIQKYTIW